MSLVIFIMIIKSFFTEEKSMRYYGFELGTNTEKIKENAKIELRHYGYDNVLESINSYMYQNMKNNRTFLVYREEDNLISAIFSFDEQKLSFQNVYEGILEMLRDTFGIKQVKVEPFEITMHQFMECFLECKRRRCFDYSNRIIESSNLWIYYYSCMNDTRPFPYDFKERIISEQECEICSIYHQDFVEELRNIKAHANLSEYSGNLVHYVISSRSFEAAGEMTEVLVQNLRKANRINSRRMEIVSEIEPNLFRKNNHLEEIIENSYGGVIVLDLSEKASLHMVFTGNPGTAKTTVARLFAEIMKDEKILSTGVFVEAGRADLVGEHVGATAPLVKKKFKEAQGGVLFIDEAYSLCDGYDNGFGDEAINTIVQEMENHRDNVIVIFAGYPEPMKAFLDRNPGMRSRIAFSVEFDDYTVEELCEITKLMLSRKQMTITEAGMKKLKKNFESVKDSRDYGNGRFARKMLEEAEMNLAERICQMDETEITTEVLTIIEESDIPDVPLEERRQIKKIGFAC